MIDKCVAALSIGALLSGCILPPKAEQPSRQLAAADVGLAGVAVSVAPNQWWKSFNDEQLDALINDGLRDSPTLEQARARIATALSQAVLAHSRQLPSVNADGSVFHQRAPANFVVPPPLSGHSFAEGQAGFSLGWDLDLWGKQADAVHRAQALAQAAGYDEDNAQLMLAGAIVQAYVEYYRYLTLANIAERSEQQRQNIINITRQRVDAGLDTQLELRQAEGQLPQARLAREQASAAAELAVHQLAALVGKGAEAYDSFKRPTLVIETALPVPTELPINLLSRRPDVLSARLGIDAADAQRLANKAAFYPDVSLRALAGIGAFGLGNLFDWSARGYAAGPGISLPIFDGGRLKAEYRGSESQLDAAIAVYNDTVLRAVQQTADQLTRIDALVHEQAEQRETLDADEAAYRLAEKRYKAGLAGYLSVLNAETQVLNARQGMVDILSNQALSRVMLLLATGGSFEPRGVNQTLTQALP